MKSAQLACALLLAFAMSFGIGQGSASASSLKTLYSFCAVANCTDGSRPSGPLLMDSSGNFYGLAASGGNNITGGVAFELVKSGSKWKYKRLYSFCSLFACGDGGGPLGGLIMDTAGDLYGTTRIGGSKNDGAVFELIPNAAHTKYKLKVLYSFCAVGFCSDGANPQAGLTYADSASGALYDGASPLYGITSLGGPGSASGIAFQLKRKGKRWTETVLHSFCDTTRCPDGNQPLAPMIVDGNGNLYGTATAQGVNGGGVAFELTFDPHTKTWNQVILHAFCATFANNRCQDGTGPGSGGLLMDTQGNLFGTTKGGGSQGGGTAFKIVPSGTSSTLTTLYNFCSLANCADGSVPSGDLTPDVSGDLFGTASAGGANADGAVFKFNGTLNVLYSFCAQTNCTDGKTPGTDVVMDTNGHLFGVTNGGGANGAGTVFEFLP